MITNKNFSGTGVAIVTPFEKDGRVDEKSLKQHVEFLISNGVNYIVALGTTSEAPTLSSEEKVNVVSKIIEVNKGRVPLMVGVGGYSTQQVIDDFSKFNIPDVDAFLSVAPYYNKPNQEGLYAHFAEIAKASTKPIIMYNIPSRTSVNMLAETTLKLARDFENIIGIKEASGIENQIMKIIKHKPDNFLVISGDDAITLPLLSVGADGVISVIANAYPQEFVAMVNEAKIGNFHQAKKTHYLLLDIIQACFKEGNPAGIKAVLFLKNRMENVLRLPLTKVSNEHFDYIKKITL